MKPTGLHWTVSAVAGIALSLILLGPAFSGWRSTKAIIAPVGKAASNFCTPTIAAPGESFFTSSFGAGPIAAKGERKYLGLDTCSRCHTSGVPGFIELPGGVKIPLAKEEWVLYKELPIWSKEDKHAQAFAVLLNERSKKMGERMGIEEVHRHKPCLACHTGFPVSQMTGKKGDENDFVKILDVKLGVSCEGCHGPSGDGSQDGKPLAGWYEAHQKPTVPPYETTKPWRFRSPKEKTEMFGFFDVRSPSTKNKLCVSCHLGDVEQCRIITHEMYAAGHPPLPAFELETFAEKMPKHWAEFRAKKEKVQELFLEYSKDPLYTDKVYKKDDLRRTRSMLTGAVVSASEYLRLAGQLADSEMDCEFVKKPSWPEMAVFDCYACHHDLKIPAWRQLRKPPVGFPGRPALLDWPFALSKIALKTLGTPAADVETALKEVRAAVGNRPFGEPTKVAKTAKNAAGWLYEKAREIERKPLNHDDGVLVLKDIAVVAATEFLDYDSARQLIWAFRVIESELGPRHARKTEIEEILGPLGKKQFLLDIRDGRKGAASIPGEAVNREIVEVNLEKVFPFVANYDPNEFRAVFRKIAELLK